MMRKYLLLICVFVMNLACTTTQPNVKSKISNIPDCIARITTDNAYGEQVTLGTAVCVAHNKEKTYFITAKHVTAVISDTRKIKILNNEVSLVYEDPQVDISIISVPGHMFDAVIFKLRQQTNESCIAMGFWTEYGTALGNTKGMAITTIIKDAYLPVLVSNELFLASHMFKSNLILVPGFSGGPIFDINYNLLGINSISTAFSSLHVDGRYIYNVLIRKTIISGNEVPLEIPSSSMTWYENKIEIVLDDTIYMTGPKEYLSKLLKDRWTNVEPWLYTDLGTKRESKVLVRGAVYLIRQYTYIKKAYTENGYIIVYGKPSTHFICVSTSKYWLSIELLLESDV